MLLLIDNYDSFTWNLVQRLGEIDAGLEITVLRNDAIDAAGALALDPTHLILSPGPCTPKESGICPVLVEVFRHRIPILGVCLGHQTIGDVHGMEVRRAAAPMHGKTSLIHHDGRGLFAGISNPFVATRYHSLIVERDSVPPEAFEVSAWTDDGVVMGLRRRVPEGAAPMDGVQFHPESFLTVEGPRLLTNFLAQAPRRASTPPAAAAPPATSDRVPSP